MIHPLTGQKYQKPYFQMCKTEYDQSTKWAPLEARYKNESIMSHHPSSRMPYLKFDVPKTADRIIKSTNFNCADLIVHSNEPIYSQYSVCPFRLKAKRLQYRKRNIAA